MSVKRFGGSSDFGWSLERWIYWLPQKLKVKGPRRDREDGHMHIVINHVFKKMLD